jgi:hypothetical protein
MKTFRIRASAAGSIMAGKHRLEASEAQLKNIATMEAREKPMTPKQKEKYDIDVEARDNPRDNPELPATAKSYCKLWHKEQVYKRRKEIFGDPLEKGNFCEDESIRFLNKLLLEDHVKNEEYKEDGWMTGTADIIGDNLVIDMKNSFTFDTFPLHDFGITNKDYYYQLQVYMHLYGKTKAELRYCLMNMPHHMIERAAKREAYLTNKDYDEVFTKVYNQLTYDNVEPKYKYKTFPIDFDPAVIEKVKKRVELCRIYIKTLIEGMK